MEQYQAITDLFSGRLQTELKALLSRRGKDLEEIRLRSGSPVGVVLAGREISLQIEGELLIADQNLLTEIIRRAGEFSAYAIQTQIRQGYLTIRGGHRIGLCGRVVPGETRIESIVDFQAVNIRVARDVPGAADGAADLLWRRPASALILGAPGSGKTTVLRDLIRQTSDRFRKHVGVVDERGELAACLDGRPQLQIGRLTDVLSNCPKQIGIELLLRTMRPDWIAVDEISAEEDVEAVIQAANCGVRFLATAHAWDREDLQKRPVYQRLIASGVFTHFLWIRPDRSILCERSCHAAG